MNTTDCIVIGGGIAGLMTARELALSGQKVILLERGEIGRECSWAGAGILSPLYPWREPAILEELIRWGQAVYPVCAGELLSDTGIDPEWWQSGLLVLETREKEEALAWAEVRGCPIECLDSDQVGRLDPAMADIRQDGLWLPEVAQIRNPRLIAALKSSLQSAGVEIREHTMVERLVVTGRRVTAIITASGEFSAAVIVITAGAWSGQLLAPPAAPLSIRPVRGQMICCKAGEENLQRMLLKDGIYIIPRRDGHVLVGSTVEEAGFDKSTTPEARDLLESKARAMWPAIARIPVIRQWSGLRPAMPDGLPVIGPCPGIDSLYLNTGHYRSGILLAPGSARLAADMILGRQLSFSADAFQPGENRAIAPAIG